MPWPTKKLGEVTKIVGGGTPSTKNDSYWGGGNFWATPRDLAQLKIADINSTARTITELGLEYSSAELLPVGSVILSTRAPIGYVAITTEPMAINQGCRAFICREEINNKYLYYFFVISKKYLQSLGRGATFTEINKSTLENIKIPLPPLQIQKQIVERLDKIAEAQKLNDDLIQKTDELFRSLLQNELNTKFKTKKLKEVCEINPSKTEVNNLPKDTTVSFLAMADVSESAEIINKQERKLGEVKNGFTFFKDGDVLVAKITPCFENGKGAFIVGMKNGIGFGSTEFHVLRASQKILLNQFLYYLVSDKKFRKVGAKFMTGSAGQQRIPTHFLENFKISLPSLETQKKIVEKLSSVQNYKKELLEQKINLKELFDSVLHKSMRGE